MSYRNSAMFCGGRNNKRKARQMSLGGQSQVQVESRYGFWSDAEERMLFHWLGLPGNFDMWRSSGLRNGEKRNRPMTFMPKKGVAGLISTYLSQHNMKKNGDQVLNKMRYIEDKYKNAKSFLNSTGQGLSTDEEKLAVLTIRDKVLEKCPFYDFMNSIMKGSVSFTPTPPNVVDSRATDPGSAIHLVSESSEEEKPEVDVSAPMREVNTPCSSQQTDTTQRPTPIAHTVLEPSCTPHQPQQPFRVILPRIVNRAEPVKPITEQVEQMNKELHLTAENLEKHRRLDFEIKEAERRFALENRRIDLEQEALALRRLALELEFEKLRSSK